LQPPQRPTCWINILCLGWQRLLLLLILVDNILLPIMLLLAIRVVLFRLPLLLLLTHVVTA
jgi:hypothetical protein